MPHSKIAVISDTHNALPDQLVQRLKQADEIWHLGDVTSPGTIIPLQNLDIPLLVVCGNCDPSYIWPDFLELERNGFHFRLQHRPPRSSDNTLDAILYGHLHEPLQDNWQSTRILNPGAINGPRNGSQSGFAWIQFHENNDWTWEIETL